MRTVLTIVSGAVLIVAMERAGRWAGTQSARNSVIEDAEVNGSPAGVFGTRWLMSKRQVQRVAESSAERGDNELIEFRQVYGRDATVRYMFQQDMLVGVLVTFADESSREKYDRIQHTLAEQYGPLSAATTDADGCLTSTRVAGRFGIEHVMLEVMGAVGEQLLFYRTKQ